MSPRLDQILLLTYVVSLAMIISLRFKRISGEGMGNIQNISAFNYISALEHYFEKEKCENVASVDQIYGYITELQT